MVFSGTVEKCKVCDKTVHFIDMTTADGNTYHKTCFRCKHCNGLLVMSNYSSMDGVLYCKTHFDQLFKETGNFSKKFQSSAEKKALEKAPSKLSSFFSGTQDKCATCKKTVYPLEKVTVEGENFHKSCFRCAHGGCFLTPSSYAALDGILYCKHHFSQLFMQKGSYSYLTKNLSQKKTIPGEEGEGERKGEGEEEEEQKPDEINDEKPEAEAEANPEAETNEATTVEQEQ